jgi:hypothetical protein
MKLKWAHFTKDGLFLFFLGAPYIFPDNAFFDKCGGQLSAKLVGRVGMFFGRQPFWLDASGLQASLVGEGQDSVSLENT